MELVPQANIIENQEKPTEKSKFREKYANDPEFKARYLQQMYEDVECECGCIITRNNMSTHKKNRKHAKLMQILIEREQMAQQSINKQVVKQFKDMFNKLDPQMRLEVLKNAMKVPVKANKKPNNEFQLNVTK
jgi:hypothetical protein